MSVKEVKIAQPNDTMLEFEIRAKEDIDTTIVKSFAMSMTKMKMALLMMVFWKGFKIGNYYTQHVILPS